MNPKLHPSDGGSGDRDLVEEIRELVSRCDDDDRQRLLKYILQLALSEAEQPTQQDDKRPN